MLKRLFIAVFVLGLVIGLNGTAYSDIAKGSADLVPIEKINPDNPRHAYVEKAGPDQPAFRKPAEALEAKAVPAGLQIPAMKALDYFCDIQDYTSGNLGYGWTIPDAYGDDLFNMRFTSDAGYDCTLKVAHLLMYGGAFSSGANAMTGDPDMRVYLWDDDGFGFPGNKLDSVTIPWSTISAEFTTQGAIFWLSADFAASNWVFSDGAEYHYGWTTLQNSADDTLCIFSDPADGPYAGEERASENWNGAWGTMLNDWGIDVSFFILSERCCSEIPYSDCHSLNYATNISYYWGAPHQVYGDEQYAERFTVTGPETLVSVDIPIYFGTSANYPDWVAGDDDVYIRIYDDDGTGLPGALLYTATLPGGTYPAFPTYTNVPMPAGMVMYDDFHVSFGSNEVFVPDATGPPFSGDFEATLSSDGSDGTLRSSSYWDTTGAGDFGWVLMGNVWSSDYQFDFTANLCKDEYADCSNDFCYNGLAYLWGLPDRYGDIAEAQKFSNAIGEECELRDVWTLLYWSSARQPADGWDMYSVPTVVTVYADGGGLPGAPLGSVTVNPGDYGIAPPSATSSSSAWLLLDFEGSGIYVAGAYWIAFEPQTTDTLKGIQLVSDAGGGACVDTWAEDWGPTTGNWHLMTDGWGVGPDWALVMESQVCCIPYSGRVCLPPQEPYADFPTLAGDFARSGATYVPMEDAWCDLTLNWHYEHPTQSVSFTGPVAYDNKIVCSFTGEYIVFDMVTGAQIYNYVPNFSFGPGDIRCAPTITMITGYPDPVMFVSGGTNEEVHAVNFNTGAMIWARAVGNVGPTEMFGNTRWGNFVVLTIGGTDYVFWGTTSGNVVGADALTGTRMAGYPVALGKETFASGATDGTQLFYGTYQTGLEGDLYAIDAATGTINWQLSATAGLQGAVVYDSLYDNSEGFSGGISYDPQRGYVYANSRVAGGDYPSDGLFYRLNASTGALVGATQADRVLYSTPVIDANRVYVTGFTRWASPPAGGDIYAVNKGTGLVDWGVPGGPDAFPYYCSPVLSCEPEPVADQLYAFAYDGFMSCFETENGDELFRRRVETPGQWTERGMGGLLAVDGAGGSHLAYADLWGNLFDLTKQADRPRLEFQAYNVQTPVEFGAALSLNVVIPGVFTNTGCADLEFYAVNADTDPFGVWVPGFAATKSSEETMHRASDIADKLTTLNAANLTKYTQANMIPTNGDDIRDVSTERGIRSTAAGFPPFLNGVIQPSAGTIIAPGDTVDLVLDVIQANINRGPQDFYLNFQTNDPDFFLNDPTLLPEMHVTIVGGCLIDTTTLVFGMGGANEELVTNTGMLGNGDWGDGAAGFNGFLIDGDGSDYYQGSYVWAVSTHRIATYSADWISPGSESFVSMQPDPNWCDNDCKPYLDAGLTLGYITNDGGLTYAPVIGDMVCKSYLDSVQNFYNPVSGEWEWEDGTGRANSGPFDNDSTMGLYATGRTVAAPDVPELANFTVEVAEITERNGNEVPNWYFGEFWDCDLVNDLVAIDRDISTAWVYNSVTLSEAFGQVKIPFGCGEEPLINTFLTWGNSDTDHGFWDWQQFWDTCYTMLSSPPGAYNFTPNGDEEAVVSFMGHDFAPNETIEVGIAHFGLYGMTDASSSAEIAPLAHMANKWSGFGRGDVNNDNAINLADIIYLAGTVNGGPGAVPFQHLSDVNADGAIDGLDVDYLIDYYFNCGACPMGEFIF